MVPQALAVVFSQETQHRQKVGNLLSSKPGQPLERLLPPPCLCQLAGEAGDGGWQRCHPCVGYSVSRVVGDTGPFECRVLPLQRIVAVEEIEAIADTDQGDLARLRRG